MATTQGNPRPTKPKAKVRTGAHAARIVKSRKMAGMSTRVVQSGFSGSGRPIKD